MPVEVLTGENYLTSEPLFLAGGGGVAVTLSLQKWKLLSRVQLFVTPWTIQSMEISRPEYWSG